MENYIIIIISSKSSEIFNNSGIIIDKCFKTNDPQVIPCFDKSDTSAFDNITNIVCYNISWATQVNIERGTEHYFVKKCKEITDKAEGILSSIKISRGKKKFPNVCTQIGLEGLINYNNNIGKIDIICFQECHYQGFGYKDTSNDFMNNNVLEYLNNKIKSNGITYDCVFSKPHKIQSTIAPPSEKNIHNYNAIFF